MRVETRAVRGVHGRAVQRVLELFRLGDVLRQRRRVEEMRGGARGFLGRLLRGRGVDATELKRGMVQFAQGLERDRVARGELAPPRRRRALRGRRRSGSGRGSVSGGAVRSGGSRGGGVSVPAGVGGVLFRFRGGVSFPGAASARLRVRRRRRRGGGRPRRRRDRAGDERRARRAEFVPRRRRRERRRGVRRGGAIVPRLRVAASAPPAAGADAAPRDPRRAPGAGAAAPARGRGRRLRRGHPKRRNARWGATSHRRGRDLTEIAKLARGVPRSPA